MPDSDPTLILEALKAEIRSAVVRQLAEHSFAIADKLANQTEARILALLKSYRNEPKADEPKTSKVRKPLDMQNRSALCKTIMNVLSRADSLLTKQDILTAAGLDCRKYSLRAKRALLDLRKQGRIEAIGSGSSMAYRQVQLRGQKLMVGRLPDLDVPKTHKVEARGKVI